MPTIMIVDDEERIRKMYRLLFEQEGYTVITASNINDARRFLKIIQVNLVLLDINMGEFSGDILYEIIQCFHPGTKLIVSSVYSIDDQRSIMPKADDYFDKSEGNKKLLDKVRDVIGQDRAHWN
ncbi:MAG: response regulator [Candidatus Omnitrophica bacterium]|nr:response regulator [Candidatus Omnitrophota bacterium]